MGILSKTIVLVGVLGVLVGVVVAILNIFESEIAEFIFLTMLTRITIGKFCLIHPNGQTYVNGVAVSNGQKSTISCDATMIVHDAHAFNEFIFDGFTLGFGEAYMNGKWDIGENDDLQDIVLLLSENVLANPPLLATLMDRYSPRVLYSKFQYKFNSSKSIVQDAIDVQHHYDIGNEFYEAMLDGTMTYTCAIWSHPNETLKEAQENKVRVMDAKLDVQAGDKILDVGSGWGYLVSHLAKKYADQGVVVHGITLSRGQYNYSTEQYASMPNVEFHLRDYREYLKPQHYQEFDKIVSVGMISHVHIKRIQEYMNSLAHATKPGGRIALHFLSLNDVYYDFKALNRETACDVIGVNFIGKYIFPGGCVLHPDWVHEAGIKAGFTMVHKEFYGYHYVKTLRLWRMNLNKNWPKIKNNRNYDERLKRMYEFYLTQSEVAYRLQRLDLAHLVMVRNDEPVNHIKRYDWNNIYTPYRT